MSKRSPYRPFFGRLRRLASFRAHESAGFFFAVTLAGALFLGGVRASFDLPDDSAQTPDDLLWLYNLVVVWTLCFMGTFFMMIYYALTAIFWGIRKRGRRPAEDFSRRQWELELELYAFDAGIGGLVSGHESFAETVERLTAESLYAGDWVRDGVDERFRLVTGGC